VYNYLHPDHVTNLNFAQNRISVIEDHAFDKHTKLAVLLLGRNLLETVGQEWFNGLGLTLENLDLSWNKITSIPDGAFKSLTVLQYLNLDGNRVKTISDNTFDGLYMLRSLSIDYNPLSRADGSEFCHLKRLETISIEYTQIEHLPVFRSNMTSLKQVMLNGNMNKNLHSNAFAQVPTVEQISLDKMPLLETIEECAFCNLPNLTFLLLSDSPKIRSIDERAFDPGFGFTTPMVTLDFSNNSLTSLSPSLVHWKSVGSIYLAGNRWNCSCSIRWMTEPSLKIVDIPNCYYPQSLKDQPITKLDQSMFVRCARKMSYATPKLFIAMTIILLIAGTVLISWYVWSSRRGDGRLSNPFRSSANNGVPKPPYAYKNLAMNPDETEQVVTVHNGHRPDQEDEDDAPYPAFDQKNAKAGLV